MKQCHVHNPPLGNVCCSLQPSADGGHAKMPRDPILDGNDFTMNQEDVSISSIDSTFVTRTSMRHRMKTVNVNQNVTVITRMIVPMIPVSPKAFSSVIDHSTSDSWAWANDRAHNRR